MKAPISVCLIVRNESTRIVECLSSVRPYVEEICVVDTGSSDGTQELIKNSGLVDRFEEFWECNEAGSKDGAIKDFSQAREKSFQLATQPWVMWLDGDDVIRGAENLKGLCDRYANVEKIAIMAPYEYSHDHHGNVTCRHYRERIMKPAKLGKWVGPIHEVWVPDPGFFTPSTEEVTWVHKREGKVDTIPLRNLRILNDWLAKNDGPDADARMLYYAALEFGMVGDLAKSIELHERYCAKSGWEDEKCLSMLQLAEHHQRLGNYERMVEWATEAMLLKESWAEPRFALARGFYFLAQRGGPNAARDWERCVNHALHGLSLPHTQTPLFINPVERTCDIHRYLNVALDRLGRVHEARASVEQALKVAPDDPNLNHNRKHYVSLTARWDLDRAVSELVTVGAINENQVYLIGRVLEGKYAKEPNTADGKQVWKSISDSPAPVTRGENALDVVIFTGQAYERWNPQTLESAGMGGSETMAWELARRIARLGHRVRMFADAEGIEGTFEGVEWIDWKKYSGSPVECDVIISSRIPELFDFPVTAKLKLGWVHDVSMGSGLTNQRSLRFDRFLCLSNWHKGYFLSQYPFIHPDSVLVTRNGIDLTRYDQSVPRERHRLIYSSSPDRGLQIAMQAMPLIRTSVPDAVLHVYYGFANWEKHPDEGQQRLCAHIKSLLNAYSTLGMVEAHGRVSGVELAQAQLRSGVWAYPTWFQETSCITAMEAQAAGCRIVTSPIAALNETVADRGKMIPGYWLSPEYLTAYSDACVEALLASGDGDRTQLQQYARDNFSLDTLAVEWVDMFHRLIVDVKDNPLQKYQPVAA